MHPWATGDEIPPADSAAFDAGNRNSHPESSRRTSCRFQGYRDKSLKLVTVHVVDKDKPLYEYVN
jgi:hypothetical protein